MTPTPRYANPEGDLFALMFLILAGALVAAMSVLWLAGHLVLLLGGHGWTDAPLSDAHRVLIGLGHGEGATAVSYTHLTLPTIYSV